jgi:hypothetical protein
MIITQEIWIAINKLYTLFRTKERLLKKSKSMAKRATKPHVFWGIDSLDRVVPVKDHLYTVEQR